MTDERLADIERTYPKQSVGKYAAGYELLQALKADRKRIEQLESERREIEGLADGWHGTRPTTNTGYATGTHFANELRAILNK